uniref:MIR domain-containing protein n=1 Tax=Macrostomum lignano TaxID=282301 RepID=A0A1I8FCV3_9PLAT
DSLLCTMLSPSRRSRPWCLLTLPLLFEIGGATETGKFAYLASEAAGNRLELSGWPLRLLARSPQAACRWLQQLLVNLLSVRPDLSVPRPLVTEQALTDRLKLVCQAEAPSFSVDLLALLLKEFGVFAKRNDLKSFLQTMDAAKEVLGQMAGLEIFQRYATGKSNGSLITPCQIFHQNSPQQPGSAQNLAETLNQLRSIATVDSNLLDLMLITRRLTDQLSCGSSAVAAHDGLFHFPPRHNTYLMEDQLKGRATVCLRDRVEEELPPVWNNKKTQQDPEHPQRFPTHRRPSHGSDCHPPAGSPTRAACTPRRTTATETTRATAKCQTLLPAFIASRRSTQHLWAKWRQPR